MGNLTVVFVNLAYWRGFWNDRGTWVGISVIVSGIALWSLWFVLDQIADWFYYRKHKRPAWSAAEEPGVLAAVLLALVCGALAGGAVSKAWYENRRYERYKENSELASQAIYGQLTDEQRANGTSECVRGLVSDDWSAPSRTPASIKKEVARAVKRCNELQLSQEKAVREYLEDNPSEADAGIPSGGSGGGYGDDNGCGFVAGDCSIPQGDGSDWGSDESDPCAGYNVCVEGPSGRYGEDFINDPLDVAGDGR